MPGRGQGTGDSDAVMGVASAVLLTQGKTTCQQRRNKYIDSGNKQTEKMHVGSWGTATMTN